MIRVGKIINCHGYKGELKVWPLTDDNKRFKKLKKAFLEMPNGQYTEVMVVQSREHKGNVLMFLEGIEDMDAAERLKNIYLCVAPEDAIRKKGHYFIYEIVGLEVYQGEELLGKVAEVLQNSSANDVYVVKDTNREFGLPALKSVIHDIDIEQGRITVTLPDGLLD